MMAGAPGSEIYQYMDEKIRVMKPTTYNPYSNFLYLGTEKFFSSAEGP